MAVVKIPQAGTLTVKVQDGVTTSGNPNYKNRSWNSVNSGATDAAVFAVGSALADVQSHTLVDILRVDRSALISQ